MSSEYNNLFRNFKNRDKDLSKVKRYKIYTTMYYRTDLVIHSHRVSWIIRELNPFALMAFGTGYDTEKAEIMGLVHDDAEIVMGDIEAGIKNKMSAKELGEVYKMEEEGIKILARRFPDKVGKYSYRQLLQESFDHSSLESQVMQYADKFDPFGEALHEVYAGNHCFMTPVVNDYGTIDLPLEAYYKYFTSFFDKFPQMRPLLKTGSQWFQPFPEKDFQAVVKMSRPHTAQSIHRPTGFWPYDQWINANLKGGNSKQIERLYERVEY